MLSVTLEDGAGCSLLKMIKPQALTAIPLCQLHQELWNSTKHGAQTDQLYLASKQISAQQKSCPPFESCYRIKLYIISHL